MGFLFNEPWRGKNLMSIKALPAALIVMSMLAVTLGTTVAEESSVLTGRFVARVGGLPLTSFGWNRQSYIIQITSEPGIHFAILRYTFFIYQPQPPRHVFDFLRQYTFRAVKDDRCDQTVGEASKRFIFDGYGHFVGVKNDIDYSRNAPSLTSLFEERLPCYVVSPESISSIQ